VWTNNDTDPNGNHAFSGHDTAYYLAVYCTLGIATQIVNAFRTLLFAVAGIRASTRLHENVCPGSCPDPSIWWDEQNNEHLKRLVLRAGHGTNARWLHSMTAFFVFSNAHELWAMGCRITTLAAAEGNHAVTNSVL
jgi:hypothetical protein